MFKGIDVSHNNGVIDWQAVKAGSGIDFAVIRAGYGLLPDMQFDANMKGAAAVGMPVAVYYFSYATSAVKAAEEATHCCSLVKKYIGNLPYIGSLPIYFDFEYDSEVYGIKKGVVYTNALRTEIHKAFCDRVRAAGYTAGIYTNVDYITSRLNFTELRGYSLWLASWPLGAGKAITHGDINAANVNTKWGKPAIWQIGLGAVNGIKGNVDLNYGYVQLQALKNTAPPINSPQANTNPVYKTGDKVGVVNTTVSGGVKRGKVYGGGTFVVYHKAYDVISAAGKCVVIGVGKAVTAAVNADDLRKI